ncbi:acyltransferase family protein [Neobacillus drentensis]|uniref:acyltransferase family protein n=1 Tax=Neobacillus drentensis TaxID=220684 RepID=UPI002FFDBF4F
MAEKPFIFSRDMTAIAKGLAIVLMVYHHLFAFPSRISSVDYKPLMMVDNIPLDMLIGEFGKLCVAIFLFLSGLGLYKSFQSKHHFNFHQALKRVFNFFLLYWIIFFIFIPIGLKYFDDTIRYSWNSKQFFYNLFALIHTYNGEWWFISVYIELVLLFPLLVKMIEKGPIFVSYLSFICLFLAAFFVHVDDFFPKLELVQIAINHLSTLLTWQIMFVTGIYFSKYSIFEKMNAFFSKIHLNYKIVFLALLVLCFYFRQDLYPFVIKTRGPEIAGIYNYSDFIVAPIAIFSFVKLVQNITFLEWLFGKLGKHSTTIWLTHTFFIYYYFQEMSFAPYYSTLIVIWVFILTILVSIGINFLNHMIHYPFFRTMRMRSS